MFGLRKSPAKLPKHHSADPGFHKSSKPNPFDSDDELDNNNKNKHTLNPSKRTSSEPSLAEMTTTNPFDGDKVHTSSSKQSSNSRYQYKNNFRDSGGVESQSVQELEGYAVYKAEETTKSVQGCLKVAEDIRSDATRTLVMLHEQGEQITRTHHQAVEIDHDLSRGEKLLGSLGGMFSKTWKPKKTRPINGPVITRDHSPTRRINHLEKREKLGLNPAPKAQSRSREPLPESADAYQRVEMEKAKQDDGLSDLSDILGELKNMAVDMGSEIEKQNKGLDHLQDDVDELNFRVQQSNQRGRHLLRK
ncbi:SNAP25 homologous protein SNAP33 [Raphanus sativus]|uniref:SNAP25 homologous protein SNAP33 n=1 Tax=Raphanus sativus TaxID=3726 RepID=A0A6J0JD66_RAPSA|nr:SNAP25 homologous protein SNAP33 [Raphanus sativus]XP_018432815.1 SNAP25 homologous protein SNAP33 [Raphanus sativus]XP_056855679.1 SNAP25 homologous protein SNAP33 [Raphanus sativus]KAJ4868502.1 SNAP25 homologous protein SNAP33 [Raphanus sativus]KAJ4900330.1 SNAP25 homologous protein SNAP33 [Raphanus sativus]